MIDLRSDTITRPTAAMLTAMAAAELGDDVLDGDPTTRRLEARAAALVGHEAAAFVPSGTMGNLLAVLSHTRPGDEVLLERDCHMLNFESNGVAAVAGCLPVPLVGERGHLTAPVVAGALAGLVPRGPGPSLVWLENSANLAGGTVQTVAAAEAVCEVAHAAGLRVHLDGARVHNAAAALGVPVDRLTRPCDSVMFCLSKGLSCPVGSLLCGSAEFIARARECRRQLGGALRQSGVLAAAGLVALDTLRDRLAEDHANARRLATGLAALPGLSVELDLVETNIVWFRCADPDWPRRCLERGVRFIDLGGGRCRAVTCRMVDAPAIERALEAAASALEAS